MSDTQLSLPLHRGTHRAGQLKVSNSQLDLPLPLPAITGEVPLVPARMVNEFNYCARLGYLMWVQGEWAESADTLDGTLVHKRVDSGNGYIPDPDVLESEARKLVSRSVQLSSDTLGVIAKIDLAESENGIVTPIDYKRGKRPHISRGVYEPERIQVCLQALLLEEHGYQVNEGIIYYVASRERVRVTLDDLLRSNARRSVHEFRLAVSNGKIPAPLEDSAKCHRCALVSICLPDEIRALRGARITPRPISVKSDDALPLIIQSQFARINRDGEILKISDEKQGDTTVRIGDISDLAVFGNVNVTTATLTTLMERNIPITFHSHGGWFRGVAHGLDHRNVEIRTEQYQRSFDNNFCQRFARDLVVAKITNQRTMLRRNWRGDEERRIRILNQLKGAMRRASQTLNIDKLRGIEGDAAHIYFRAFAKVLSTHKGNSGGSSDSPLPLFRFESRNRRPPTDPVNALLSLAYALLTRNLTIAIAGIGLDPYRGFFHAPRYGKPALALDLMEPFRPIIADSVVLSVINGGEISAGHFVTSATGTSLTDIGRKKFITAYERRLSQETTHTLFGYKLSMRRLMILQARLLSRLLLGELQQYPHYLPR